VNHRSEALELVKEALALDSSTEGEKYARLLCRARELDPDLSEPYFHLGVLYYREEKWEEALRNFSDYIELDYSLVEDEKKSQAVFIYQAKCYQKLDKKPESLKFIKSYIGLFPQSSVSASLVEQVYRKLNERKEWLELLKAGHQAYREGKYEDAIKRFQDSMELNGNFSWANYYCALAMIQVSRFNEAVLELKGALELDEEFLFMYHLARAYRQKGDNASAEEQCLLSLEKNARYVPALILLGELCKEGGDHERARGYLEKAFAIDTGVGELADRAEVLLNDFKETSPPDAGQEATHEPPAVPEKKETVMQLEEAAPAEPEPPPSKVPDAAPLSPAPPVEKADDAAPGESPGEGEPPLSPVEEAEQKARAIIDRAKDEELSIILNAQEQAWNTIENARLEAVSSMEKAQAEAVQIVKDAEAKARSLADDAEARSAPLLDEARHQAETIIEEAKSRAALLMEERQSMATAHVEEAQAQARLLTEEARLKADAQHEDARSRAASMVSEGAAQVELQRQEARNESEALIAGAREKVDALLAEASGRAEAMVNEAREKAKITLDESHDQAQAHLQEARGEVEKMLQSARGEAERLIAEANESAGHIVTHAQSEARSIVEKAQEERERIIAEARSAAQAVAASHPPAAPVEETAPAAEAWELSSGTDTAPVAEAVPALPAAYTAQVMEAVPALPGADTAPVMEAVPALPAADTAPVMGAVPALPGADTAPVMEAVPASPVEETPSVAETVPALPPVEVSQVVGIPSLPYVEEAGPAVESLASPVDDDLNAILGDAPVYYADSAGQQSIEAVTVVPAPGEDDMGFLDDILDEISKKIEDSPGETDAGMVSVDVSAVAEDLEARVSSTFSYESLNDEFARAISQELSQGLTEGTGLEAPPVEAPPAAAEAPPPPVEAPPVYEQNIEAPAQPVADAVSRERLEVVEHMESLEETMTRYRKMVDQFLQEGAREQAAETMEKIKGLATTDVAFHIRLGRLYVEMKSTDAAEREFKSAIGLDGRNVEAFRALGTLCIEKGAFRDALLSFKNVLTIEPNDLGSMEKIGDIHRLTGNKDLAVERYLKLSIHYGHKGRKDKELELLKKIIEIDPAHKAALEALAKINS